MIPEGSGEYLIFAIVLAAIMGMLVLAGEKSRREMKRIDRIKFIGVCNKKEMKGSEHLCPTCIEVLACNCCCDLGLNEKWYAVISCPSYEKSEYEKN